MQLSIRSLSVATLLFLLLTTSALLAKDGDRVHIAESITVGEDEQAGDLVCIACSIVMKGRSGDVVAIAGSVEINGDVRGDVVAIGGALRLDENASVAGDAVTVGGRLLRHPDAAVKGSVSAQSGIPVLIGLIVVPLLPLILVVALIVWLFNRNRRSAPPQVQRGP